MLNEWDGSDADALVLFASCFAAKTCNFLKSICTAIFWMGCTIPLKSMRTRGVANSCFLHALNVGAGNVRRLLSRYNYILRENHLIYIDTLTDTGHGWEISPSVGLFYLTAFLWKTKSTCSKTGYVEKDYTYIYVCWVVGVSHREIEEMHNTLGCVINTDRKF